MSDADHNATTLWNDSSAPTATTDEEYDGNSGPVGSLTGTEIFTVVIYWTIGSLGLIGNTLVCLIFRVLKRRRSQVNLYILNQACADLITSLMLIAFGMTRIFRAAISHEGASGVFLCRLWWSRFFLFSGFAVSAHNLTLMSIERYIAVVHPLRYAKIFTRKFTKITIGIVWLVAPIMQWIFPIFQYASQDGRCIFQATWSQLAGSIVGVMLFMWEYFIPCMIMFYAYVKIVLTLRRKAQSLAASNIQNGDAATTGTTTTTTASVRPVASSNSAQARRRNVTITLLTVFVVYVVCWTPNQFTFLQFNLGGPLNFDGPWYHITVVAAFINSCSNPFVYALMHKQFKAGLKTIARCRRGHAVGDVHLTDRSTMGTVVD